MSCVFHVAGEESLAKKEKSISDFEMERRRWGYDAVSRSTLVERSTPRQPRPLQGPAYFIERDSLVAPSAARERERRSASPSFRRPVWRFVSGIASLFLCIEGVAATGCSSCSCCTFDMVQMLYERPIFREIFFFGAIPTRQRLP